MKGSFESPWGMSWMLPGPLCLWMAAAIFAASGAVTQKLMILGAEHLVDGHNPISLCNLLFVGNLCALLVLVTFYRTQLGILRTLSRTDWIALVAVAVLVGALAPALFLGALGLTMVNNVTLVSRLEPLLTLALAAWILRERTGIWDVAGAATACLGVLVTVALQGGVGMLSSAGLGITFTALAAVAQATASIVSRRYLGHVPIGAFSVARTGMGTVVFFCIALALYGGNHFAQAFSPFLWQWMLLYGTLIVVVGQTLWVVGLRRSRTSDAALAQAFNPLGAVLAAYLILGEVPTFAQLVGGGVIVVGIVLGLIGAWTRVSADNPPADRQMAGGNMGFRGV